MFDLLNNEGTAENRRLAVKHANRKDGREVILACSLQRRVSLSYRSRLRQKTHAHVTFELAFAPQAMCVFRCFRYSEHAIIYDSLSCCVHCVFLVRSVLQVLSTKTTSELKYSNYVDANN